MNTKEIRIQIKNKIATAKTALPIVCDNSDYVAVFEFVGDDWAEYAVKTARFVYNGSAVDVVMTDDRCEIPVIHDAPYVEIGVYAGDVKTSTPAYVRCLPSITSHTGSPADPTESVYNQLMEKLNDLDELSDEELAAAIDAYFAEHPAEQQPLRFTGAANATYDGSEAVEVFIPRMDTNEYDPAKIITAQPYTANSLLTKYVAPSLLVSTESMIADGAEMVVSQQFPNMYALGRCITQLHIALTSIKNLETAKQFVENAFTEFVQLLNGGYITLPFIVHYGISSGIDPNTQITIRRMRVYPEGVEAYSIAVQYGDGKLYMLRYDSVDDMSETTRTASATVDNYYFTTVRTPLTVNRNLYPEADSGKVLTVNDNGVIEPQALESLTVTVKGGSDECSADKTFDEILQAVKSGRTVWGYYEDYDAQLDVYSFNDEQIVFVSKAEITPFLDYRDIEVSFVSDGSITIEEQGWPSMKLTDIVDDLTSDDIDKPLSANQGKVLKEMIDGIDIPTVPTALPNPSELTIKSDSTEQSYDGSAAKSVIFPWAMAQLYGALGDGTTDDTAAIQSALANNRYVYIPAGTYKLSGTLDIRDGCRLELAPDAILNFTQTSGNCITLGMSAELRGNFATLVVPYAFSGNVIYISTASSTTLAGVPPYTRWTPQWKPARYVSDICITKPDSRGFHYSIDGNCSGTILSDFLYYETSYDIRSLIYTDTASNFEKMTILQEPFTRWFKPSEDGLTPYFYNGTANKELLQKDAFDALFQVSPVANFTNKLPTAATADGSVYNSMGYKNGVRLADADGTTEATLAGNTITGFIPCAEGDIIRLKGISFATNTYSAAKVYLYKSDHTKLAHVNHSLLTTNGSYYNIDSYEATDEGCSFRIVNGSAAYFRLSVDTSTLTAEPVVTVNEEITYSQAGFLADSVSVKASSVYGLEDYIKAVIAANG